MLLKGAYVSSGTLPGSLSEPPRATSTEALTNEGRAVRMTRLTLSEAAVGEDGLADRDDSPDITGSDGKLSEAELFDALRRAKPTRAPRLCVDCDLNRPIADGNRCSECLTLLLRSTRSRSTGEAWDRTARPALRRMAGE